MKPKMRSNYKSNRDRLLYRDGDVFLPVINIGLVL